METTLNINEYTSEKRCVYKDRIYFVRDNGAVYRQARSGQPVRKNDEEWTFGRPDKTTSYLMIGSERVHRIVCTAFHGEPIGERNIADHIDTNRHNNRPENLRWVTKLENAIGNPITRAKIETVCGSIQAFLDNPSILRGHEHENPNFTWMRAVTPEEAMASYNRWKEWADKPIEDRKSKGEHKGPGEWIFSEEEMAEASKWNGDNLYRPYKSYAQQRAEIEEANRRYHEEQYGVKDSLTPGAKQLNWKTPTEFLLCPQESQDRSLQSYMDNLTQGKVFTRTQYGDGGVVLDFGYNEKEDAICVLTYKEEMQKLPFGKPWALCKITLKEGVFIHENEGSFFQEDGGLKYFTIGIGHEWTGGDVFDDYC